MSDITHSAIVQLSMELWTSSKGHQWGLRKFRHTHAHIDAHTRHRHTHTHRLSLACLELALDNLVSGENKFEIEKSRRLTARAHKNRRVKACNSIKFETGQNLPPVLKIVTHTAHTCCVDISPLLLSM